MSRQSLYEDPTYGHDFLQNGAFLQVLKAYGFHFEQSNYENAVFMQESMSTNAMRTFKLPQSSPGISTMTDSTKLRQH